MALPVLLSNTVDETLVEKRLLVSCTGNRCNVCDIEFPSFRDLFLHLIPPEIFAYPDLVIDDAIKTELNLAENRRDKQKSAKSHFPDRNSVLRCRRVRPVRLLSFPSLSLRAHACVYPLYLLLLLLIYFRGCRLRNKAQSATRLHSFFTN